jgi:hypothetical protein
MARYNASNLSIRGSTLKTPTDVVLLNLNLMKGEHHGEKHSRNNRCRSRCVLYRRGEVPAPTRDTTPPEVTVTVSRAREPLCNYLSLIFDRRLTPSSVAADDPSVALHLYMETGFMQHYDQVRTARG